MLKFKGSTGLWTWNLIAQKLESVRPVITAEGPASLAGLTDQESEIEQQYFHIDITITGDIV